MGKQIIRFNAAQFSWLLGKSVHRASEIMDELGARGVDVVQVGRTKSIDARILYEYINEHKINTTRKVSELMPC